MPIKKEKNKSAHSGSVHSERQSLKPKITDYNQSEPVQLKLFELL